MLDSPFSSLPSPGNVQGAANDHPALRSYEVIRARVVEVPGDRAGNQLAFTLTVVPLCGGISTGAPGNTITGVRMLHPGFGTLDGDGSTLSGMISIPEEGSICLCVRDDAGWVAVGWFSGPVATVLETERDKERMTVSYNPGIETPGSRITGVGGWDVPDWAFGAVPGDQILFKGQSRVKATTEGLVMGSGSDNMELYRLDGGRVRVVAEDEERGVGWHRKRSYDMGDIVDGQIYAMAKSVQGFAALVSPPPDAHHYEAEVIDAGTNIDQMRPYLLHQRGHVSPSMAGMGRTAVDDGPAGYEVLLDIASMRYSLEKTSVIEPLNPTRPIKGLPELVTGAAAQHYDYQVYPDGSFHLRSGNRERMPFGETREPTTKMAFSFEFDARTNIFNLRVGQNGAPSFDLRVNAETGAATLTTTSTIAVNATGDVSLNAPRVSIRATDVNIQGNLNVNGIIEGTVVKTQTANLTSHTHLYATISGPASTGPAM